MKALRLTVLITALCLSLALPAGAAEKFPTKPLTLLVNFAGGGTVDTSSRILAKNAEKYLGMPITIQNRPGGQATTAIIELQNKKPDGYTIGVGTWNALTTLTHLMPLPYTAGDFDYIFGFGEFLYGIGVKADSSIKSIADIKQAAAAKGGQLSFSAAGYPHPITMFKLGELLGVKFNHVSVKSSPEAYTQVLGGHVDLISATLGDFLPLVKSGEIRLLAVCSPERLEMAPDTPTLVELGYNVTATSRMVLIAPKGVPADRMEILREAFRKAYDEPEFKAVMQRINMPTLYTDGPTTRKAFVDGEKTTGDDLKAMGLTGVSGQK